MRFDAHSGGGGIMAGAFDDIRIERTLRKEWDRPALFGEEACLLFEDADELCADDLTFLFGVDHVLQAVEETPAGIDGDKRDMQVARKGLYDLFRLAGAQQTGIDEDAGELIANCAMDEQGRDRGVDAAGKSADDPLRADAAANLFDGLFDGGLCGPVAFAAADAKEEVADDIFALRRVRDFGMKLQPNDASRAAYSGDRIAFSAGEYPEPFRQPVYAVTMA